MSAFLLYIQTNESTTSMCKSALFLALVSSILLLSNCSNQNKEKTNKSTNKQSTESNAVDSTETEKSAFSFAWKTKKMKKESCFDPDPSDDDFTPFCSFREIETGEVSLADKQIENRLNSLILTAAIGGENNNPSIKKWLAEVNDFEEKGESCTESVNCQLIEQGGKHIVVAISTDYYCYSAAHPTMELQLLNLNLQTGRIINLSDLFKPGFGKALTNIAEKQFIKQNGTNYWNFTPGSGDFELAKQFSITSNGLVFNYNQYEIGPYAAGMPEVILPYTLIRSLLRDDFLFFDLSEN